MLDTITPIRVFISSPGDLVPERAVVRAVLDQLNHSSAFRFRFKFIAYAWEHQVPALMGQTAQEVVDTFLLDPADADILVCLFWQRMGSPQERLDPETQQPYQSGTEYEFLRAYHAYQARGRPLILLYRCLRPFSSDAQADVDQAERVERFFARFGPGGELKGLIGTFLDTTDFEATLARDIAVLVEHELASRASPLQSLGPSIASATRASTNRVPHEPANNLPLELTSFVGRSRELALLGQSVASARLVTLTGVGGIGKTRLALRAAHELLTHFSGGVWLVELAPLADEALLGVTIATVLEVREELERPLLATLASHLRDKQLLLVLDNCEHLVAGCARLAEELLRAAPQLHILATSREPLLVAGEAIVSVPTLAVPEPQQLPPVEALAQVEAIQLFVERARALEPAFELTSANAAPLIEICRRLEGIALALELAAARVRMLTVEQIARRLEENFGLLRSGSRTALARQQTLAASIEWSYRLLSEAERVLLRRLGVFAGGWRLEAAEALAGGLAQDEAMEVLSHLVDKSLVQVERGGAEARYRLLEPIRHYALERLAESGEADAVRQQHATYFLELAEQAEPELTGPEQGIWFDLLEQELDNVRAALAWGLEHREWELPGRIGAVLWRFWLAHGHLIEGRRWLEAVLAQRDALSANVRAQVLNSAGVLAVSQGDYAQARAFLEESLALWQTLGNKFGIAKVLHNLATLAAYQSDFAQAFKCYDESLALLRELGDTKVIAIGLNNLGSIAHAQGEYEQAATFYSESLEMYRASGNIAAIAMTLNNLGMVANSQGDYERAGTLCRESLLLRQRVGDKLGIAECLEEFAAAAGGQLRAQRAARLFGMSAMLREIVNVPIPPYQQPYYERIVTVAQSQLDETSWTAAWAEGRAMTLEQAIAYALEAAAPEIKTLDSSA